MLKRCINDFLKTSAWQAASCLPLTGDASTRKYFRLRQDERTAILMDATENVDTVAPFLQIGSHLQKLGLSAPSVFASDPAHGLLIVEDFGEATFTRLLEGGHDGEGLYSLAVDLLIAIHKSPAAIPNGLRDYSPENMFGDIELFLDWCAPAVSAKARQNFRDVWGEALVLSRQVPTSLLLRDFHVANLMLLERREGIRRAGVLDFQDAYQGPVSYDLVSLLEDARRDVPPSLKEKMIARYLRAFPKLNPGKLESSMAVVAAQRHTRVLAVFERLSRRERKHEYRKRHSPRVWRLLQEALSHPALSELNKWYLNHAR